MFIEFTLNMKTGEESMRIRVFNFILKIKKHSPLKFVFLLQPLNYVYPLSLIEQFAYFNNYCKTDVYLYNTTVYAFVNLHFTCQSVDEK